MGEFYLRGVATSDSSTRESVNYLSPYVGHEFNV
jgi:hypothetical protein